LWYCCANEFCPAVRKAIPVRATPIHTPAQLLASVDEVRRDPGQSNKWYVVRKAKAMGMTDKLPPEWQPDADKITSFRDYTAEDREGIDAAHALAEGVTRAMAQADAEDAEDLVTLAASAAIQSVRQGIDTEFFTALDAELAALIEADRIYTEDAEALIAGILGRRVKSEAGSQYYKLPIGAPIVRKAVQALAAKVAKPIASLIPRHGAEEAAHEGEKAEGVTAHIGKEAGAATHKVTTAGHRAFKAMRAGHIAEAVRGGHEVHLLDPSRSTRKVVGVEDRADGGVRLHLGKRMGEDTNPTVDLHKDQRLLAAGKHAGVSNTKETRAVADSGHASAEKVERPTETGGTQGRAAKMFRLGKNLNKAAHDGDVQPGDIVRHNTGTPGAPRPVHYRVAKVTKDKDGNTRIKAHPVAHDGGGRHGGGHSGANVAEGALLAKDAAEATDPGFTEALTPDRVKDVAELAGGDKGGKSGGNKGTPSGSGRSGASNTPHALGSGPAAGGGGPAGDAISGDGDTKEVHASGGGGSGKGSGAGGKGTKSKGGTFPKEPSKSDPSQAQLFKGSQNASKIHPIYTSGGGNNPVPNTARGGANKVSIGDRVVAVANNKAGKRKVGTVTASGKDHSIVELDEGGHIGVLNTRLEPHIPGTDGAVA
jgi:hypothetical protein